MDLPDAPGIIRDAPGTCPICGVALEPMVPTDAPGTELADVLRRTGIIAAAAVGIGEVRAGVLPEDKKAPVDELHRKGAHVAVVGDGVNDAPALAAADCGIAMDTGAGAPPLHRRRRAPFSWARSGHLCRPRANPAGRPPSPRRPFRPFALRAVTAWRARMQQDTRQ